MELITPNGELARNNLIQERYMKRFFTLLCMIIMSMNMGTSVLAQATPPRYLLQSIETSSSDSSLYRLDFGYDATGRLTKEIFTKVNTNFPNSSYYNFTSKLDYGYSDDKLTMLCDGREYSTYNLEDGNIRLKELEYEGGRLKALSYFGHVWIGPLNDDVDKVCFHWEGDDISVISYYRDSLFIGSLSFEFREEKCNSPLIYAYIFRWMPSPYVFWHETWANHAALFHCGPLTPTRLIDSCTWSTGENHVFAYMFDNQGNPVSMSCNFSKLYYYGYFIITYRFTWKEIL